MHYWYGFTGEALVFGYGRAIRGLIESKHVTALREAANEQYDRHQNVNAETYIAAFIAALAMKQLGTQAVQVRSFSSAAEIMRLFAGLCIEQVALNFWNGRVASSYANKSESNIANQVANAFKSGEFLTLPRDAQQIYSERLTNELPGAVSHLLSRSNAERKAFNAYLRRGTPPVVTTSRLIRMTKSRSVQRTWEREAQLEQKGHACEYC